MVRCANSWFSVRRPGCFRLTRRVLPVAVVTMAATNRPNAVDPALRRPGRFDREIYIGPPSPASRLAILQVLTDKLDLSAGARDELQQIADSCAGYVGADFGAMCREAALLAMGEKGERAPVITASHLQAAVRSVRPASQRSMWSTEAPRTKWSDIGGLCHSIKPLPPSQRRSQLQFHRRSSRCEGSPAAIHRVAFSVP